mgnify:CR=1 FL=1|jgi:hypothetical protein
MTLVSDYTFEKLIKYDSSNVSQLIRKLEIEIKSLELEIQYRLDFRNKVNSFTRPIIPAGTKMHFSHPKIIYHKYIDSYDTQTKYKQNQLASLKDEKQRVLLNQSLSGIEHGSNLQFTPFVFTSNVTWNPSWQTAKTILDGETAKLNSQISTWKNNEMLKKEKTPEKVILVENQSITFNEQVNSGDYNETPITDVNLNGGCSECTGTEISSDPILRKGYHIMPDGSLMKDSDMGKEPLKVTAGMAGIAAFGIIGLLLYTRSVKK